ncbi:DUF1682 domain-containing protein [bacterium]|nr:DUF1682 domain-containing protein [bacterium]
MNKISIYFCLALSCFLLQFGCAHRESADEDVFEQDREKISEVLSSEVSLAKDRSSLDELRKDIPEDKRVENDEEAWISPLLGDPSVDPNRYRQKYQYAIRKKRDDFRKKVRKLRDDFTKEERKNRKDFLKVAKEKRSKLNPKELERKELNEKYRELDSERREFFSEQRERRKNFESELNAQSKDFNMEMREKQKAFNDQLREYSKRHRAWEKEQKEAKKSVLKSSSGSSSTSDFQKMNEIPSNPLEP